MTRAQAFVFDACGTLFDVHSVVVALNDVTADAEAVSSQWRAHSSNNPRHARYQGHQN